MLEFARVSLFPFGFRHFEFCISSQSGQRSEKIKKRRLGVLSRETSLAKWQKNGALDIEALGNPVCSKDECLPLDIRIVNNYSLKWRRIVKDILPSRKVAR